MQQVHFCSGSVFVTGDQIAMSLLRYVQAITATRGSDVTTVPSISSEGIVGTVTVLVNGASQISADSYESRGPELKDDGFVSRLDILTHEMTTFTAWSGEDSSSAA